MASKINKILTNQSQEFSNEELANVSASLSAILGQGGGTYSGDGRYINVKNDNTITMTQTAASLLNSVENKLNTDIYAAASGTWEDVASAYQTYSGDYLTESATSALYYPLSGNPSGFMDGMFIAKYNETTIAELDSAYNANQLVYCMVPTGTTGTRLAFLAFINTKNDSEACYEFQYYRSSTSKSIGAQSDQVVIFSCMSATGNWTSGTRNTNAQIVADTGLSAKMSGNKLYLGVSADYALKSELPDLTDYATKTYANEASANALSQAETWVGQQNFATSAGLSANKQFAMTTTGWKEIQGGGGGTTYTAGEGISIDNDVISFSGAQVAAQEYVLAGNGTVESPFNTSSFYENYLENLAAVNGDVAVVSAAVAAMGGAIKIIGNASCTYIDNLQASNIQPGDAYIATTDGTVGGLDVETGQWKSFTVHSGDMVVLSISNNTKVVSVLATTPNLTQYTKLNQRTIVKAGVGVTVSHTENSDGAVEYTVNTVGGGGEGTLSAYTVTCSGDNRFDFERSVDPVTSAINYNMTTTMPNFINVTATPTGTLTPNSYYFVYEE